MNTSSWSVSDVSNYLKQIGLGQYSQSFYENDISGNELPFITEEYLVELGVTNIDDQNKFIQFRDSIENENFDFCTLESDEKDMIHPLSEDKNQQILINENIGHSKSPKVQCKICHQHFNPKIISYHEKVCQETFNKCKQEFTRRGLVFTDEDIVDLLAGRVPKNSIKLQKCEFCGKKISPKLFTSHVSQCKKKFDEKNQKEIKHSSENKNEVPKADFKDDHNKLIELIKKQKKEGGKVSQDNEK
ncbi:Zinc finger C2HC domain-containing protein 1A [Tritrichomonas musculus]|uniref:Zinc finger C2HC domain-containing protein 1A n=1 Tax=Tritrichomonas musculus TaxID=1915356 RepID=A0ABR2KPB2_9EUKA